MIKIGNALKAIDAGKWVRVPAVAGEFWLKVKPLLPGEQFALKEQLDKDEKKQNYLEVERSVFRNHVMDWRGLVDSDGSVIQFNAKLLEDKNFVDILTTLSVKTDEKEGTQWLMWWFSKVVSATDGFLAEVEDTDFLLNT